MLRAQQHFERLLDELATGSEDSHTLAALHDFLAAMGRADFTDAVAHAELESLDLWSRNYVAAMVEVRAHQLSTAPPDWTSEIAPLEDPWFATPMACLRLHLLRSSPVPFRRRNLFVDATVGARV